MKSIILLLFCIAFPLTLAGKKIKRCKLDKRPFIERRADYDKIENYPSRFIESNDKPETLYLGEDTINIGYSPLSDFKGIGVALAQDNVAFSPLIRAEKPVDEFTKHMDWNKYEDHYYKRDFDGQWIIKEKKLYLKSVKLCTPELYQYNQWGKLWKKRPISKEEYIKLINPPQEEVDRRVEEATGRKWNKEGLIFADWFTGTLIGYQYQLDLKTYLPISETEKAVKIEVIKGVIKSVEIRPLIELKREDRRRLLFFERTQSAFGERIIR